MPATFWSNSGIKLIKARRKLEKRETRKALSRLTGPERIRHSGFAGAIAFLCTLVAVTEHC